MSSKNEKTSTSDQFIKANYQAAGHFVVGARISHPAMTQQVRTVVTSLKEGSLGLRYAPHAPKVTDVSTSS